MDRLPSSAADRAGDAAEREAWLWQQAAEDDAREPEFADADLTLTPAEVAEAAAELEAACLDGTRMTLGRDASGVDETLHFDDAAETLTIERVQDVEATLEWCKGRYNEGLADSHCEFRHVARLPVVVLEIFGKKRGLTDPAWYLKRGAEDLIGEVLNDRDLAHFRTLHGRF